MESLAIVNQNKCDRAAVLQNIAVSRVHYPDTGYVSSNVKLSNFVQVVTKCHCRDSNQRSLDLKSDAL